MTSRNSPHILRLAALRAPGGGAFDLRPDADALAALARDLGLLALRKLSLTGTLRPAEGRDWLLEAQLGATAVQPCVVTGAPVTTRIDAPVQRHYTANMPEMPDSAEAPMPEDDTLEPLPDFVDLMALLAEALALELPDWPRAPGAELGEAVFAPPGVAPLRDEDTRPFAGLAALKQRLEGED